MTCAGCSDCSLDTRPQRGTPYEVHITVDDDTPIDAFRDACELVDAKPLVITDHRLGKGRVEKITRSTIIGTDDDAHEERRRVSALLTVGGIRVVREKIETAPWHAAVPRYPMPRCAPLTYFEGHATAKIPDELPREKSRELILEAALVNGLYVSQSDNHPFRAIFTARALSNLEDFAKVFGEATMRVDRGGLKIVSKRVEFVLFDSKPSHDIGWFDLSGQ